MRALLRARLAPHLRDKCCRLPPKGGGHSPCHWCVRQAEAVRRCCCERECAMYGHGLLLPHGFRLALTDSRALACAGAPARQRRFASPHGCCCCVRATSAGEVSSSLHTALRSPAVPSLLDATPSCGGQQPTAWDDAGAPPALRHAHAAASQHLQGAGQHAGQCAGTSTGAGAQPG